MKVLQVHARYRQAGGEDAVVAAEARLLRGAGHDVVDHHTANPTSSRPTATMLLQAPWNAAAARQVRDAARRHRPDVAHVHNTWFAFSPSVVATLHAEGVPVVATLHNYRLLCAAATLYRDGGPCEDCVGRAPWPAVRHRCYRGSALASAAVATTIALDRRVWHDDVALFLTLSEFARDRFVAGGLPADRLRVHHGFVADAGPRATPPSQSRTVLYVGRLAAEKGVNVVLDAWRRASIPFELVVVGDGPQRAALERAAPAGVRFVGTLGADEVRQEMLRARALLFPSQWYEGQPVTLLEAMASGLPVVATRLGGPPELLGAVAEPWLVAPGASAPWDAALRSLVDGSALDAYGVALRERFCATHTADAALARLLDAYGMAIAR